MKKIISMLLAVFLAMSLNACGKSSLDDTQSYHLYYLTEEINEIVSADYTPEVEETGSMIAELVALQNISPVRSGCLNLLPSGVVIDSYSLDDEILTLYMSKDYLKMDAAREVLANAGLVKTFLQIPDVSGLQILVDGEKTEDSKGNPIGVLRLKDFVDAFGNEVNSYKSDTVTLYFTDKQGTGLYAETRKVYHNINTPVEKVVVEELIKGPSLEEHCSVLSSDTNILNVTTQDGICYVGFDDTFQNTGALLTVAPEITIYAIVDSLVATCGVKKVQFSVNGDTEVKYRDSLDLQQLYEVNESFIK